MKINIKVAIAILLAQCLSPALGSAPALAGALHVRFTDSAGNPLQDAVIEVVSPAIPVPDDWDYSGVMDQVDKEFVENVILVVEGSLVSFPNSDNILHHVYSFSDNKSFELPLYIGNSAEPVLFDAPGATVVGCNIHDWMLGYIYVGESHLMAKSGPDGVATLQGLDAGAYTFKVWHGRARPEAREARHTVMVPAAGAAEQAISLDLNRDRRIRRAPTSVGGGLY